MSRTPEERAEKIVRGIYNHIEASRRIFECTSCLEEITYEIADAEANERERCVKVARFVLKHAAGDTLEQTADEVGAAIRKPPAESDEAQSGEGG